MTSEPKKTPHNPLCCELSHLNYSLSTSDDLFGGGRLSDCSLGKVHFGPTWKLYFELHATGALYCVELEEEGERDVPITSLPVIAVSEGD